MSAVLTVFMFVIMLILVMSFFVGAVMFVVDVIRFAPARNRIQMMSSRLQSLIDAEYSNSDSEDEDEDVDEDVSDSEPEHVCIFKKKVEEVIRNVN